MLIVDVNILVYAFRADSPRHAEHKAWLEKKLTEPESVGVSELALSGLVRIVTNGRIYREPESPEVALAFCQAVLDAPAAVALRPGAQHWPIFAELCHATHAKGNVVPDAYHAALAIENRATWVTTDRGFARFPGLRWQPALN
jgi:toxin-antitoxin system PIN domain toxin